MKILNEIYKCEICGKVIEILIGGSPETICCGKPMILMEEKTDNWQGEKHVPKITNDGNNITVDVGISMGTPHPMTEEHWIMWIDLMCKDDCYKRKFLKPGDEPKATFIVKETDGLWAREFCNLHGLWKSS